MLTSTRRKCKRRT